jgi:hypothetical protein
MLEDKKNIFVYVAVAVIIVIIIFLMVNFPYNIKAPCQIVGQKEWALIQVDPDKIISKIYDNKTEKTLNFTLLQFNREDFVQFEQYATNDGWIYKGDPVAVFTSLDNQISLAELNGELAKARDNLAIASTGEKQALVKEAESTLKLANIQFEAYEPQYLRNKDLYEHNLISASDWEITRATYDSFQSNIVLQKARLEVLRTGEKDEIVRYMKAHISQLESQVRLMDTKMSMGNLKAPFEGLISYPSQDSIICLIEDVDSLLCKFPVPASERKYIKPGQDISITLFEKGNADHAKILDISRRSILMKGVPSYLVTGYVYNTTDETTPGMTGIAEVQCDAVTLIELLFRSFNHYMIRI